MFDNVFRLGDYFHHLIDALIGTAAHWIQQRKVQQVLIITAVLFLSIVIPLFSPQNYLLLVVGFLVILLFVLFLLKQPALGLVILVLASLVLPSPQLPGGFNLTALLLIALIGLWLMDMFIVQRKIWFVSSRPVKPLLFLLLATVISFLFGQLRWFIQAQSAPMDAQLGGLSIFVLSIGAFLLVAQQVRDIRWLQGMTWGFLALGSLFMVLFLLGLVVPRIGSLTYQVFQQGATRNSLFWTWIVALSFSQALINDKLHLGWRILLGGVTLMALVISVGFMSDWKSGYLPALAVVATILALRYWRLGLLIAFAAPIAVFFLATQAIATDAYSYGTRIDAWLIMYEIVKVSPIFGLGPANYYWYTPLFPIRGWAVQFNSHNQYVDIIAQIGILGMVCVIWFFVEEALLGWRLRNRMPQGFATAYVYGALGGLVGLVVGGMLADWFFPFAYNIGFNGYRGAIPAWLFLGGLVSLEQIAKQDSSPT